MATNKKYIEKKIVNLISDPNEASNPLYQG